MEAIIPYIVMLAMPAGYFISSHTKPELQQGKKFFTLIQASAAAAVVALLPVHLLGGILIAAMAFAIGFYASPLMVFSLFGAATAYNINISALAIIYAIPAASKKYPEKKTLMLSAILFLAAYHFSFLIFR